MKLSVQQFFRSTATLAITTVVLMQAHAQHDYFSQWPAGSSPQEVG